MKYDVMYTTGSSSSSSGRPSLRSSSKMSRAHTGCGFSPRTTVPLDESEVTMRSKVLWLDSASWELGQLQGDVLVEKDSREPRVWYIRKESSQPIQTSTDSANPTCRALVLVLLEGDSCIDIAGQLPW